MEEKTYTHNEIVKVFFGGIGTLVVAFLIGTAGMIYQSSVANEILKSRLAGIDDRLDELRDKVDRMSAKADKRFEDRWTKADHLRYDTQIDRVVNELRERIKKLESYHRER